MPAQTETASRPRLHLRPTFAVGQLWLAREDVSKPVSEWRTWKIVAISDHPDCPVIAQSKCGSVREFDLLGLFGGADDGEESDLDLVQLVRGAL